jgi:hypothetical protein
MTVARRLTSTGSVFISGEFDEITHTSIKLTTANYFASEFDEVTKPAGVAMRETSTGQILIAGEFNEVDKPV